MLYNNEKTFVYILIIFLINRVFGDILAAVMSICRENIFTDNESYLLF